jgi:hypothetical protein
MSVHLVKLNYKINEERYSRAINGPSSGSCRVWKFINTAVLAQNNYIYNMFHLQNLRLVYSPNFTCFETSSC